MAVTPAEGSYRTFLREAAAVAGADTASVQVFDEQRGGLRLANWRGFDPTSAAFWELVVPESASTCGMALVSGERVLVPDLEADAARAGTDDLLAYRRSGLRAVQSTPLIADDGRVLGMLSTHWRSAHEPSAAVLRRFDALAQRCSSALLGESNLRLAVLQQRTNVLQLQSSELVTRSDDLISQARESLARLKEILRTVRRGRGGRRRTHALRARARRAR